MSLLIDFNIFYLKKDNQNPGGRESTSFRGGDSTRF